MEDRQIEIVQAAQADGLDPARLTRAQYRRLSIKIRTPGELLVDGAKALGSRAKTVLIRIDKDTIAKNETTCRECPSGKFRELVQITIKTTDGVSQETRSQPVPACDACNCSGAYLISKWSNPTSACPLGHWDNDKGGVAVPPGDASRGS